MVFCLHANSIKMDFNQSIHVCAYVDGTQIRPSAIVSSTRFRDLFCGFHINSYMFSIWLDAIFFLFFFVLFYLLFWSNSHHSSCNHGTWLTFYFVLFLRCFDWLVSGAYAFAQNSKTTNFYFPLERLCRCMWNNSLMLPTFLFFRSI